MKKALTILGFLVILPASAAMADEDCFVPMSDWQPREAVAAMADANGWVVRRIKIDDGCYEINGTDRDGRVIEVRVHPQSLQVIEIEFGHDGDDNEHHAREGEHD